MYSCIGALYTFAVVKNEVIMPRGRDFYGEGKLINNVPFKERGGGCGKLFIV
jgi:hypothetical protein